MLEASDKPESGYDQDLLYSEVLQHESKKIWPVSSVSII